jgi:hypothetical protein
MPPPLTHVANSTKPASAVSSQAANAAGFTAAPA